MFRMPTLQIQHVDEVERWGMGHSFLFSTAEVNSSDKPVSSREDSSN